MNLPFDREAFDLLGRWQHGVASFVGVFDAYYGSKDQLDRLRARVQNENAAPIKFKQSVHTRYTHEPDAADGQQRQEVARASTISDTASGLDEEDAPLAQLQKRAPAQCSGVGIREPFAGTLYNCSGTIETLASMSDATEKRVTLTPCAQCPAGNATCTATCCSVLTTSATYHCTCPIDRLGKDCESPRPYTCTLHPQHPHMNCTSLAHAPMPRAGAGPSPCAPTHLSLTSPPATLSMGYHLNCTFTVRPNINLTTYPSTAGAAGPSTGPKTIVSWARRADEFAWTEPADPVVVLEQRVVHWYAPLSGSISESVWLSRAQLLGASTVDVAVNVTRVVQETAAVSMNGRRVRKRAYVVGGRVYVEADIGSSMWGRVGARPAAHGFLDFVDVPEDTFEQVRAPGMLRTGRDEGMVTSIVVLVVIGVVTLLAIGCLCRRVAKPPTKVE